VHPSAAPAPFTPDKSSKIRFDGSCCLNLRSITGAVDLLGGTARKTGPVTTEELTSFLWFIEMCVMSNALYFDGTVLQSDIAKAMEKIQRLAKDSAVKELAIEPIRIQSHADILYNAKAAVLESAFILADLKLAKKLDTPVTPAEHETFQKALSSANGLSDSDLAARALELIGEDFRGGKCVAALVAAGPAALSTARRAYEAHPDEGPMVTSALINRFRLNYLNQLASWRKGAYAPDPAFEPLSDQHRRLFYQYLVAEVANDIPTGKENVLRENMLQKTPLPPIGLFALMLTRERGKPLAVLITALNYFKYDTALQKLIWQTTEEGMRLPLTSPNLAAYSEQVTAQFKHRFGQLDRKAEGIRNVAAPGARLRQYVIPAALSLAADAVPVPGKTFLGRVCKSLAERGISDSAKALGDVLVGRGCNSYISQYMSLKYDFKNRAELAQPLAAIGTQVEAVFGRQLSA
jgi:hypothetical protein